MATFIFTGKTSNLSTDYNPPIYLEEDADYEIALVNFDSFYSIPNIDPNNNNFKWWSEEGVERVAKIPEGAYEISNLADAIQKEISKRDDNAIIKIDLEPVTSKVIIHTNRKISFEIKNSVGPVLGFNNQTVEPDHSVEGNSTVSILKVSAICIDCNIAGGSFLNGKPVHVIHQFYPSVSPGFKLIENPAQPIYFPIVVKAITNITVRIIDQDGNLLNFRDDICTIRLHLRKTS